MVTMDMVTQAKILGEAVYILHNTITVRYYLPTPPHGQDMTQGQFLSGV